MTDVAAQAPRLTSGGSVLKFALKIPAIVPLMLAGLIVRLAVATIDGFGVDMGTFQSWAVRMSNDGPWNFYSQDFFTDYAPGYMYVLWLIGEINQIVGFTPEQFEYALKLPSIVADLASAFLLYVMLKEKGPIVRLGAAAMYLFLPITLFIGALWGQVDSILAFFLLLSVYYIGRDRPVAGAVAFTVGFLVKPQAAAALPLLAFWIIREHPPFSFRSMSRSAWIATFAAAFFGLGFAIGFLAIGFLVVGVSLWYLAPLDVIWWCLVLALGYDFSVSLISRIWNEVFGGRSPPIRVGVRLPSSMAVLCTVIPLLVMLVLITPFFAFEPWRLIEELYDSTNVANYRVNSFWAYNFWMTGGLFEMGFKCDLASACQGDGAANATEFLGLATRYWSLFMFTSALALVMYSLRNARGTGFLALGTALSMLAFYLFLTRMHERYVFPAFLPLLAACALLQSRVLWAAFVASVTIHFLNLYHVFGYYYFFNPEEQGNFPGFVKMDFLYHWLEKGDAIGFSLPLVGTLATVQVLSILFVACFAVLLSAAYTMSERSRPPQAAPQ